MERLAVIIPIYNHQEYLTECLDSVLMQKEISQIVLIDDASSDDSLMIAKRYEALDPRVLLIINPDNLGRAAARNIGIQHADCKWITFCDADDFYKKGRFNFVGQLQHPSADGYYEDVTSIYEHASLKKSIAPITGITDQVLPNSLFKYLLEHQDQSISIIGLTVRREAILELNGFDQSLVIGEDTDLIWRLARDYKLEKISRAEPRVIRRVHAQNTYQNEQLTNEHRYWFYKKWVERIDHPRINNAYRYYKYRKAHQGANVLQKIWAWVVFRVGK